MKDSFLDTQNGKNSSEKDSFEKQKRIVRDNSGFSPRTSLNIDLKNTTLNDNLEATDDIVFSTAEIIDFAQGADSD